MEPKNRSEHEMWVRMPKEAVDLGDETGESDPVSDWRRMTNDDFRTRAAYVAACAIIASIPLAFVVVVAALALRAAGII